MKILAEFQIDENTFWQFVTRTAPHLQRIAMPFPASISDREAEPTSLSRSPISTTPPTWLTVHDAAIRARGGPKLIYREVAAGRLRCVRVSGRRSLRFRAEWIDAWLEAGGTTR